MEGGGYRFLDHPLQKGWIEPQLRCPVGVPLSLEVPVDYGVGQRSIRIGKGKLRIEAYGLVVVLDGPLELPHVGVGDAPAVART